MEMGEHMLNELLECLNKLKAEYADKPEELTCKQIAEEVFEVMKYHTMDRRNVQNLFGMQDLSLNDLKAMQKLDYSK